MQEVDLLQTFDARVWAKEFVRIFPDANVDEDLMATWFANSLMCGWDHHYWSTKEYKKRVRDCFVPWWRRLFVPLSRFVPTAATA